MAIINKNFKFMELPLSISRQDAFPVDRYSVFYKLSGSDVSAAEWYALNSPLAYPGQVIAVVNEESSSVDVYKINIDGSLSIVGAGQVDVDGKSIEKGDDGILRLKGFSSAVTGQQLRIGTDGNIEWFTPDTTTVEGLNSTVAGHTSDIASLNENKADKATTLAGYGITDAYTKEEVDGLVAGAFHFKGTVADVASLPTEGVIAGDVYHVTANAGEYAYNGTEWVELGSAFDLSAYQTTEQADAKYVAKEDGKGLSTNDFTDALMSNYNAAYDHSQEAHAPAEAQENVIESVSINGSALPITDKGVSIPMATGALLGVVKGSTEVNGITIGTDGTMSVNEINVQKLMVATGDRFILDGGNAQA